MDFRKHFLPGVFALCLAAGLCGCTPPGQDQSDDEKEPHYVLGLSRVNAMDFQGAVEAFEESLEVDPRSAAAHYQLAMLFDSKAPDPAAAIYHYQEYLKLNPNAGNADVIRQRIYACKQQLAADVMPLPSTPAMQQQLEKLTEQNRQLQDEVDKWRAWYQSQQAVKTNSPGDAGAQPTPSPTPSPSIAVGAGHQETPSTPGAATRTHAVASGETEAAIARKYSVKLSALQAANPGVNPNKLRVGQVLNIPPP